MKYSTETKRHDIEGLIKADEEPSRRKNKSVSPADKVKLEFQGKYFTRKHAHDELFPPSSSQVSNRASYSSKGRYG